MELKELFEQRALTDRLIESTVTESTRKLLIEARDSIQSEIEALRECQVEDEADDATPLNPWDEDVIL